MDKNQRKRIEKMESILNEMSYELDVLEKALQRWKEKSALHDELDKYYGSDNWRKDFEDSRKADFPSPEELPHGILSEDGIFNEMIRYRELGIDLLKTGVKMIE